MKKILRIETPLAVANRKYAEKLARVADKLDEQVAEVAAQNLNTYAIAEAAKNTRGRAEFFAASVAPTTELELKLVQDTRIDPNVIHLYLKGHDYPLMQFAIREGKLKYYLFDGLHDPRVATEPSRHGGFQHPVIAEDRSKNAFSYSAPKSAEAFPEPTNSGDCGAQK